MTAASSLAGTPHTAPIASCQQSRLTSRVLNLAQEDIDAAVKEIRSMIKRRGGLPFAHLRDEMDDKIAQRERHLHKLEKRMAAQLKIRAKAAARAQAVARQADACRGILARCCVGVVNWLIRSVRLANMQRVGSRM